MGCGKICQAKKAAANAQREADIATRDANKQAADAKKQADAAAATGSIAPYDLTVKSYSVEVITIGKFLGIDNKKNALSIREMRALLQTAARSPQILSSAVAKNLIQPITVALGAYVGFDIGRKIFLLVKPGFKILQQINDIVTFNFAALNVMIWDIAQMIVQILLGFAPFLIELLKNIFLSIPLYTKILTTEQTIRISGLMTLSQIEIKENITDVIVNFKVDKPYCSTGAGKCPEITESAQELTEIQEAMNVAIQTYVQNDPLFELEDLTDVNTLHYWLEKYMIAGMDCSRREVLGQVIDVSKQTEVNILDIPGMANETVENKNIMKQMVDGLVLVSQKTESAIAEELLRREFSVSQTIPSDEFEKYGDTLLASAMADNTIKDLREELFLSLTRFNTTDGSIYPKFNLCYLVTYELGKEVEKKLKVIEDTRQDIITVSVAEELVQSNKIQIFDNIIGSLTNVGFDPNDVTLNDCMSININSDFNTLKTNIVNDNNTTINNDVTVVDTSTMIALRDQIYLDTVQSTNDELIIPDPSCGFGDDVCRNINEFKAKLVLQIQQNMEGTSINVATTDSPDYVDKKRLKDMVSLFNEKIVEELMVVVRAIILESVLPCKACRPCEDMNQDLIAYANKKIDQIKDAMIKNAETFILDPSLDWTITDAQSIIDKKQQLINVSAASMNANAGVVDMYDAFIYKLKVEEKEIIANIQSVIKNS